MTIRSEAMWFMFEAEVASALGEPADNGVPETYMSRARQWCRNCGHWWEIHRNGVGCLYEGCPCGVDADESAHAWTSNPESAVSGREDER